MSKEVKMRYIWRVTLYQCKHVLASSRSVGSFVFNNPRQTIPSAITKYANILRFFQFFVWFIPFILDRKRTIAL